MRAITNLMLDGVEELSASQEVGVLAVAVTALADALVDRGALPADLPELARVRRIAAIPRSDEQGWRPDPPDTSQKPSPPPHDARTGALAPSGSFLARLRGW